MRSNIYNNVNALFVYDMQHGSTPRIGGYYMYPGQQNSMPWFYNDGTFTIKTYNSATTVESNIAFNMDLRSTGTLNLGNDNFGRIDFIKKSVLPGAPGSPRIILAGTINVNAFTYIDGTVTQFLTNITGTSSSYVRFGVTGSGSLSSAAWTLITTAQHLYIPFTVELAGDTFLTSTNSASYTFDNLIIRAGALESDVFVKNFTIYGKDDNNAFLGWNRKTVTVLQSGTWDRGTVIGFNNVRRFIFLSLRSSSLSAAIQA